MAMLAVPISNDISRLFQQIDVEAERDPSDHITIFYFGDNTPINKIAKMMKAIFDITSETTPFEAEVSKITSFPEGKHGYPIIAEIKSKSLNEFREKIEKEFKKSNIKYDEKFPEFKPHITLGYSKEKLKDIKIDKFKFSIAQISLYGGDEHDERIFINFPFSFGISKSAKINVFSEMYLKLSSIII